MREGDRVRKMADFPDGKYLEGTVTALNEKTAWVDLGDRNFLKFPIEDLEVLNQDKERVYLFRAKRRSNGEWVQGAYFNMHHNDKREHIHHFIIPDGTEIPLGTRVSQIQVEVDPSTISQFTGMYDYNGNKIFDGDILDNQTPLGTPDAMKFRAEWIDAGFVIVYYGHRYGPVEKNPWGNRYPLCRNNVKDLRIIGNRWDNPDIISENNDKSNQH